LPSIAMQAKFSEALSVIAWPKRIVSEKWCRSFEIWEAMLCKRGKAQKSKKKRGPGVPSGEIWGISGDTSHVT
jgi:hypothetical protein